MKIDCLSPELSQKETFAQNEIQIIATASSSEPIQWDY